MTMLKHTQPSGKPCSACGSYSMILKQRCSSCLWRRVKTETDELSGSRGHLAASIQTDRSFTLLFLCPLTMRWPLKHWAVRWEVTLIAPLHLLSPTRFPPSLSITHLYSSLSSAFSLFLPPSVTLWPIDLTGGEIISWSAPPWLSGLYIDCSW